MTPLNFLSFSLLFLSLFLFLFLFLFPLALPNEVESQHVVLEEIIRDIRVGGKAVARDRIVKFMSQERGIAAWATALRMVVETVAS